MIDIRNMTYRIVGRVLFDRANATIQAGQKIGLVGANGSGKTTLFNLMLGHVYPESGDIAFARKDMTITTVEQEITDASQTLLDFVLQADKERVALEQEILTCEDDMRLAEIYDRLYIINADAAPSRAASILAGLGFTNDDLSRPLSDFSGGWQRRASLAAALFMPADLLLLDEPTNHLDLETVIWLESYLKKLPCAIVIISHDKSILNSLCERIIYIENCGLKSYAGNYDTFEHTRDIQAKVAERGRSNYEERRKHLQSYVDRFRFKSSHAKQAQSRIKMIEKMGEPPAIVKNEHVHFKFPEPADVGSPMIRMEGVAAGYGDKTVLSGLNLRLDAEDRVAILGANGNGKSTLAKVIAGTLEPQAGEIIKSSKLKIAYFTQMQQDTLDNEQTAFSILDSVMTGKNMTQVRTHLGCFGLSGDKVFTKVRDLSGGEKSRLLLAYIMRDNPNLLIMDEPTNHLDIPSKEALTLALNEFAGAVILITHDFNLIELTCDSLWEVKGGTCKTLNVDLEEFKANILKERAGDTSKKKSGTRKVPDKPREAQPAKVNPKVREKLERDKERLQRDKERLEAEMSENYSPVLQDQYDALMAEIEAMGRI